MTTRRDFVSRTAVAFGAAVLIPRASRMASAPAAPRTPHAPSDPRGATDLVVRDRIERIGLELYTVRGEMQKDVAATLAHVAQIGYKEVEFAGYFNLPPEKIRSLLDANGLTSPSVHVAIEALEKDFGAAAAAAKVIGHEMLIVPSVNTRTLTNEDAWKGIAARLNAIGKKAHDAGLRFGFHNHAAETTPMADGARPYDVLLKETDPALVDFQMDIYWMVKGGGDPIAYINAYPGRFREVHVKDASAAPELAMRDVGQGTIDWKKIFALHKKAGIAHYLVENDNPGPDPFAAITTSHDYLATLTF